MANKYADAALFAVQLNKHSACGAIAAWEAATLRMFPDSLAAQIKGCPRGAFLGLCEEGEVLDIPAGRYTNSKDNKKYAMRAVGLLRSGQTYSTPRELWLAVMEDITKVHNSQMNVVMALWENQLIEHSK
jgi:hypothetical protein